MTTIMDLLDGTAPINAGTLNLANLPTFSTATGPTPAGAVYPALYVFGDSLSDAGNVATATLGYVPQAPYVDGHFTNGQVWAQDLAQSLGLPAVQPSLSGGTDFAFGGALTGSTPVHSVNPTDLPGQLAQFAAQDPTAQAGALYAIWIGSNDVLDIANTAPAAAQQADIADAVGNEVHAIQALAAHGARNLLVLDVPDLGKTPYEMDRGAATAQTATSLSRLYDTDLAAALQSLSGSTGLQIDLVDTFGLIDTVVANPGAYGFADVTSPVWSGTLTDPNSGTLAATGAAQNQYLFFDGLHPTAQAHMLIADAVRQSGLPGLATA